MLSEEQKTKLRAVFNTSQAKAAGLPVVTRVPAAANGTTSVRAQEKRTTESGQAPMLALREVQIDPGNPRKFLPPELRAKVIAGVLAPEECIHELERHAPKDLVCKRYLEDIASEAASIQTQGQLVAAKVTRAPTNASVKYRLVDGERRYWALVYLHLHDPGKKRTLHAELVDEALTADEIRRMQIAINLERSALSTMDIVDLVAECKRTWDERLATNREHYAAQIKADPAEIAKRGLAVCAVAQEMARLLARPISIFSVERYLHIHRGLGEAAARFARVHDLGVKALHQIASWDVGKQVAELQKRAPQVPIELETLPGARPAARPVNKAGRPGKMVWARGFIARYVACMARLDARSMRSLSRRDAGELLAALEEAEAAAGMLRKQLRSLAENV
jgi:hypothetical protein